jgi:hypothetical protein
VPSSITYAGSIINFNFNNNVAATYPRTWVRSLVSLRFTKLVEPDFTAAR